jgi:hypothetical protein
VTVVARGIGGHCSRFGLTFVDGGGVACDQPLQACSGARFEDGEPVRGFRWSKRLGHFPGWWWLATMGRHIGYESWLERDHVMLLDFDPQVTAVASQPFWLRWHDGERARRHAPDFFARRADGSGVVVDVRGEDRIEPRDAEAFAATAAACAQVGWEFRRVGELDAVFAANIRWLARYRHPRCAGSGDLARQLAESFAVPAPLRAGAAEVGDPLAVLPVLFHLLWRRELTADLTAGLLDSSTRVQVADMRVVVGGGR